MSEPAPISGHASGAAAKTSAHARFSDHALAQLTLVRFREFSREPEALFWVFIFPILLAAGLGIAFRDRPADIFENRGGHARINRIAPER